MPCGCRKRMKVVEEKAPMVAELIRPAHEVAMKVADRWEIRRRLRVRAKARREALRLVELERLSGN